MAVRDPLIGFVGESVRFDALLGRGGMGAVYRGRQLGLDRDVAIKVIKADLAADPGYRERFAREARTMGRLVHPHVIGCHDFGPIAGPDGEQLLVMIMEFVAGSSLGDRCAAERIPVREALGWYRQAAEALAAAHALGIVHRDVKPDNIMITHEGVAKLADFGLARSADAIQVTATGALVGSPAYMSPEAALGQEPVTASDIYSLGCSLFQTLAGQPPFHGGGTLQILHQHISSNPPPLTALRPDLAAMVALLGRCLAKDGTARPDAKATARELAVLAARLPTQVMTSPPGRPMTIPAPAPTVIASTERNGARRRRGWWIGSAIVASLGVVALVSVAQAPSTQIPTVQDTVEDRQAPVVEAAPLQLESAPAPAAVATPRTTRLVAGEGLSGAELPAGHPLSPPGGPARIGQAPSVVMSQLGRLRIRPPMGQPRVLLLLHPGQGGAGRVLLHEGQRVVLTSSGWQLVRLTAQATIGELSPGDASTEPYFCAAAVAGVQPPTWQDLEVQASMLVAPEVAPLRKLLAGHGLEPDFARCVFIARPLSSRLLGESAERALSTHFIAGPAAPGMVVESSNPSQALAEAITRGRTWCFVLLDGADLPTGNLRADQFCQLSEAALARGSLIIPVLGGMPNSRSRVLWTTWSAQVRTRMPGLPILDSNAVRAFHHDNGLDQPTLEYGSAGLGIALRDLRARLGTALRPQP